MFIIEDELKKLPTTPGVYMHKDSLGEVIYVGKAINLRNRVRSYFRKTSQADPKVRAMVPNIAEFEYISCATEMEALLLECNLIKKYMPRYNILLKDDKSYPYIEVTTSERFPRVISTRRMERDGNRYFGPYSDAGAVRRILGMVDETYQLKKCRQQEFRKGVRPCLNYFIGKCPGICVGEADEEKYQRDIEEITDLLSGKDSHIIARLKEEMEQASDELRYEDAAKYRDYIKSIKSIGETQRATMVRDRDADVLIPIITDRTGVIAQYKVRDGKMTGREITYMRSGYTGANEASEMLSSFITLYYPELSVLPRELILPRHIGDEQLLEDFLDSVNAGNAEAKSDVMHKTHIVVPERGEKRAILKMAQDDAIKLAGTLDEKAEREEERKDALKKEIASLMRHTISPISTDWIR